MDFKFAAQDDRGLCVQAKVDKVEELMLLGNLGTKLLQISRSTPYLTTALIGHKSVLVLFTFTLASKALPALCMLQKFTIKLGTQC